jgi:hypothetical protein
MGADIHQIIGALKPDLFCNPASRREVKRILRGAVDRHDHAAFLTAAEGATLLEPNAIDLEKLEILNPFSLPGFKGPVERHTLTYDSFEDSLEAFYFRFLDDLAVEGWSMTKIEDTFFASPGSGLFSDMNRRQTQAQREAIQLLRQSHLLVQDILRTAAALNGERNQVEIPLSDHRSGSEVDHQLLRSKIETLKLYARWLAPYLRQVRQMEQNARGGSDVVSLFNTAIVEITILAQREYPLADDVDKGVLPKTLLKGKRRGCLPMLVIEMRMRAAPERASQGAYGFRGRLELTATSYALNEDEIRVLQDQTEKSSIRDLLGTMGRDVVGTLNEILKQVESLVPKPVKSPEPADDPNPFLALFGLADKKQDNPGVTRGKGPALNPWDIKPDSDFEAVLRSQALLDARRRCLGIYNSCKAILNMPVF